MKDRDWVKQKRATIEILSEDGRIRDKLYFVSEVDPTVWERMRPEDVPEQEERYIDRIMADLIPLIRLNVIKIVFDKDKK